MHHHTHAREQGRPPLDGTEGSTTGQVKQDESFLMMAHETPQVRGEQDAGLMTASPLSSLGIYCNQPNADPATLSVKNALIHRRCCCPKKKLPRGGGARVTDAAAACVRAILLK